MSQLISAAASRLKAALFASTGAAMVRYLHGAVGSVLRTIEAKLREQASVMDFGAVGDGVTDDTAAIQKAIDALPQKGGRVLFPRPASYYKFSRIDVLNKSNVTLQAETEFSGSYNLTDYGVTLVSTNAAGPGLYFSNGVGNAVKGLQIRGAGVAVQFDSCLGFRVMGCNLRGNGDGVMAYGNGVGLIAHNMIRSNSQAGVRLTQSAGDTIVCHNDIGANGVNVLISTGNVRVINNHIFSSKNGGNGCGVLIDATQASADGVIRGGEVAGNLIANNDVQVKVIGTALGDADVQDIHIHHNHIHQADDGGEGFDNTFTYGYGVYVAKAKRVHIDHNSVIGMREWGIKAENCLAGVFVDHNVVRAGNGDGIVFDLVQWGRVDNNEFDGNAGVSVNMKCSTGGNYSQNNRVHGNSFRDAGGAYKEDAASRANFIYDNLGGTLTEYVLSTAVPVSQLRHIAQAGASMTINHSVVMQGAAWNGPRLIMGANQIWPESNGRLRIKGSAPTADADGTVVGAQA